MGYFQLEEYMRKQLVEWLTNNGFAVKEGVRVGKIELDVAAIGSLKIVGSGVKQVSDRLTYSFETKIATTYKLLRDVIEQAIARLLLVDYVYIVVPKEADEVWIDEKTKERIEPSAIAIKIASGTYSSKIGIIAMEPGKPVEVVREAQKSSLVIPELRDRIIQSVMGGKHRRLL
jgi:hypothetical protein